MVKDAVKKLKKVKIDTSKSAVANGDLHDSDQSPIKDSKKEQDVEKFNFGKELRQRLIGESAYVSDIIDTINFPKRADDDDDDGVTLTKKKNFVSKGGERAGNVQELRDRLQAKLTDLQSGRGEGKKAQRKKMSKEEKQLKKKEELRLKAKLAKMNASKPVALANGTSKAKPVYNSEGKMVFSKFDFTSSNGPVDQKAAGKKTKDPKAALQSIQKAKDKLKRLESSGETEKIKAIEVGSAWSKAMEKTSGAKVKDDVGLLKKSIKKQEQRKKSSKKKWDDRREGEKRGKEARISKREENIGKRKKDNKDTKMKKLAKKGRNIPGFR